jgi:hypothetical protein
MSLFAKATAVALSGFAAAVLRKMPDGSVAEVVLETDNDLDYLRQLRDEYQLEADDIVVYVKP